MIEFGFFLVSLEIFLLFLIQLILFGYFILYFLFPGVREESVNLKLILKSFGVGSVALMIYSYLIIDFYRFFHFFSIYLPIVFFNLGGILFWLFQKFKTTEFKKIKIYERLKSKVKDILKNEKILIFVIAIFLLFIVQGVIYSYLSYPAMDPYIWGGNIMYLQEYADFNYDFITTHTAGFVIFNAAFLLIVDNFTIEYFFLKNITIFLFSVNILAILTIISKFFKKKIDLLTGCIILLSFNYLMYRTTMLLPSILAVTLSLIFLLSLSEESNSQSLFIRGLLIGGMTLAHLLYGIFFLFVFLVYELIKITNKLLKNQKRKDGFKNSKIIIDWLKENLFIILVTLLTLIPYVLNFLLNGFDFFTYYYYYIDPDRRLSEIILLINPAQITDFFSSYIASTNRNFGVLVFNALDFLINKTLVVGIFFLFIGLFFLSKHKFPYKLSERKEEVLSFVRFSFLFTCIFFITNIFLLSSSVPFILSLGLFFEQYGIRLFELFSPYWVILFIVGLRILIDFLSQKISKIRNKRKKRKKHDQRNSEQIYIYGALIVGVFLFSFHLHIHYNILYTNYYQDDYYTESILYVGTYLDEKGIDDASILFPKNNKTNVIYRIIYQKNIEKIGFENKDISLGNFTNLITQEDPDFILIKTLNANESVIDYLKKNFDILYENPHYKFLKI